jgi:hypothetical protein
VPRPSGVFGGHLNFGHPDRFWEFRSIGRGKIKFEEIIRHLNGARYDGPLSIEWEDIGWTARRGEGSLRLREGGGFPPAARRVRLRVRPRIGVADASSATRTASAPADRAAQAVRVGGLGALLSGVVFSARSPTPSASSSRAA